MIIYKELATITGLYRYLHYLCSDESASTIPLLPVPDTPTKSTTNSNSFVSPLKSSGPFRLSDLSFPELFDYETSFPVFFLSPSHLQSFKSNKARLSLTAIYIDIHDAF